jgi:hypothetical protein
MSVVGIRELEAKRIMLRARSWMTVAHSFQQKNHPDKVPLFPEIGGIGATAH